MESPAPRRRFQFRLRTLLIVVTLMALILGGLRIVKQHYDDQNEVLPSLPPGWKPPSPPPTLYAPYDPNAHREWMEESHRAALEKVGARQQKTKPAQDSNDPAIKP